MRYHEHSFIKSGLVVVRGSIYQKKMFSIKIPWKILLPAWKSFNILHTPRQRSCPFTRIWMREKWIFHRFWIAMEKSCVNWSVVKHHGTFNSYLGWCYGVYLWVVFISPGWWSAPDDQYEMFACCDVSVITWWEVSYGTEGMGRLRLLQYRIFLKKISETQISLDLVRPYNIFYVFNRSETSHIARNYNCDQRISRGIPKYVLLDFSEIHTVAMALVKFQSVMVPVIHDRSTLRLIYWEVVYWFIHVLHLIVAYRGPIGFPKFRVLVGHSPNNVPIVTRVSSNISIRYKPATFERHILCILCQHCFR